MTSANDATPRGTSRKFWLLGLGIIVFAGLYSGAWFFGADRLKTLVRERLSDSSVSVACTGLDVKGYPFRIGVYCDAIGIDDKRTGTSASFGALRSAAQVYNPGHAIVELLRGRVLDELSETYPGFARQWRGDIAGSVPAASRPNGECP